MNFTDAVKSVLTTNYANFTGRSARPEFWWFALFNFIILAVFFVLMMIVPPISYLEWLYRLAVLIPSIAVGVRRLHDIDKSGWWLLITLTIIGILLIIYWAIQPGTQGPNRFGPQPTA